MHDMNLVYFCRDLAKKLIDSLQTFRVQDVFVSCSFRPPDRFRYAFIGFAVSCWIFGLGFSLVFLG